MSFGRALAVCTPSTTAATAACGGSRRNRPSPRPTIPTASAGTGITSPNGWLKRRHRKWGSRYDGIGPARRVAMIASRGATMAVDWEQRVDYSRLRAERLERARAALATSDLGAVLLFDQNNIRYVTSTHIGEWARDKSARCVLLPRTGEPVLWDFGSAARHPHQFAPWPPEESGRAGGTSMRGAVPERTGVPDLLPGHVYEELRAHGLESEPLGL